MNNVYPLSTDLMPPVVHFGGLRKYHSYSLQWLDGVHYIAGKDRLRDGSNIEPDDYEKLLINTVDLIDEPESWDWKEVHKYIPINKRESWLKKYGLPQGWNHPTTGVDVYTLFEFYNNVTALYLMYWLFSAIVQERKDRICRYITILSGHPDMHWAGGMPKIDEYRRQVSLESLANNQDRGLRLIGMYIDGQLRNITLSYIYSERRFYMKSPSLFEVCYYVFALITASDWEFDKHKRYVKFCDYCRRMYWGRRNSRYCEYCDRRTIWSRKHPKGGI